MEVTVLVLAVIVLTFVMGLLTRRGRPWRLGVVMLLALTATVAVMVWVSGLAADSAG